MIIGFALSFAIFGTKVMNKGGYLDFKTEIYFKPVRYNPDTNRAGRQDQLMSVLSIGSLVQKEVPTPKPAHKIKKEPDEPEPVPQIPKVEPEPPSPGPIKLESPRITIRTNNF